MLIASDALGSQIHFGAPFPHSFAALFQEKARHPSLLRKIALEGHKFTSQEMLETGLVDHLADGGSQGVLKKAIDVATAIGPNAGTGVWGLIKVSSPMLGFCHRPLIPRDFSRKRCTARHWP